MYQRMNALVGKLKPVVDDGPGDYSVDEKTRQVELTEEGHQHIEQLLIKEGLLPENESLYAAANLGLLHHINSALSANALFNRVVEYYVQDNKQMLFEVHD